jgi:hypothetical protein
LHFYAELLSGVVARNPVNECYADISPVDRRKAVEVLFAERVAPVFQPKTLCVATNDCFLICQPCLQATEEKLG